MWETNETISGDARMIKAISIKDKLKNLSQTIGKTMQETLTIYGLERTIYRISISKYADYFILKGGIFLYALFNGNFTRVTRDIDFLAQNIENNVDTMKSVFTDIFSIKCDDALIYDLTSLTIQEITEFKEYHGVNVCITAYLDKTRLPISIDIGFGDVIYPDKNKIQFPVLLDTTPPQIYSYSIYSAISEKFEAIVSLGNANSRYKDFYDIYILSNKYSIDGELLKKAISETFQHRGSDFSDIIAFTDEFSQNEIHKSRWESFLHKKKAINYISFSDMLASIRMLLKPIIKSIEKGTHYSYIWDYKDHIWK